MRYNPNWVDEATEITVLQLPKFKAEATELIGTEGIEAVAAYLVDHPSAGDVIPGGGGARKLRWAAKGVYVYVVIAARVFLIRCYSKNVKTDTADRGQSERSAIKCGRKPLTRAASART